MDYNKSKQLLEEAAYDMKSYADLAPVGQRVDSAIQWINHYTEDKCYQN